MGEPKNTTPICAGKGRAPQYFSSKKPRLLRRTQVKLRDSYTENVVAKHNLNELSLLIESKCYEQDVLAKSIKNNIFRAAKDGKIDFIKLCLELKPSLLNSYDSRGMTLLHNSIFNPELVEVLLLLGANENLVSSGRNPITASELASHSEIDAARMISLQYDPENAVSGGARAKRVAFYKKHQAAHILE